MEFYGVLYNTTYGGFWLPDEICKEFEEKYGEKILPYECKRDDQRIVQIVENYVNKGYIEIDVKEVPVGCEFYIHEYDGQESVRWNLPYNTMIDDLRMIVLGETTREKIHPITKRFLDFGGTFNEFETWFRKEANK